MFRVVTVFKNHPKNLVFWTKVRIWANFHAFIYIKKKITTFEDVTLFGDFQTLCSVFRFSVFCSRVLIMMPEKLLSPDLFGFRFKTRIYLVWKLVGGEKKYRSWRRRMLFNWVETDHISAPSRGEIYWGPSQFSQLLASAAEHWPSSSSWFESLSVLPQASNLPSKEKTHLLLCLFTNGLQFSDLF